MELYLDGKRDSSLLKSWENFARLSVHDAHMILTVFKCVKRNDRNTYYFGIFTIHFWSILSIEFIAATRQMFDGDSGKFNFGTATKCVKFK